MFRSFGIAFVVALIAQQIARAEEFVGETLLIESKDGSSVIVEKVEVRIFGGQNFLGGRVIANEAKLDSAKPVGHRVWIAITEVLRITEFEPRKPATDKESAGKQGDAVAKIEALGGQVKRYSALPGQPIVSVDLSEVRKLKDEDMKLLSSLSTLQELHLHGTTITDEGLKQIAGLTNLTYLGLIGVANISDAGMKSLVDMQKLEELRIGNTNIGDAGLKELAKLKSLKMVGLIGTKVTQDGLKEFSEALPNMHHNLGPGGADGINAGGGGGQRSDPNFDTSITSPAYIDTHPSVLFDEAHNNFHTASGRYKTFADLMTNDGYQVTPNNDKLTVANLAPHRILIVANASTSDDATKSAFTNDECDSVESWVKNGGSLLLITDHEPFGSASEELGKRFGVQMSLQVAVDPAHEKDDALLFSRDANQLGNHPIMTGRNESERVNRVLTFTGQSLKGPAGSVPLLKFADTAVNSMDERSIAGRSQGLALNYGKGRVVVMGEAAQLSAQVYGEPPEPMGMNVPGCDNQKMAINLMHWLSSLTDVEKTD